MPLLWPPCMVFIIDPQREQILYIYVYEQRTTCRLKREDIPPTNTPPGIRVTNAVFHVFSSYYRYFLFGTLVSWLQEGQVLQLAIRGSLKRQSYCSHLSATHNLTGVTLSSTGTLSKINLLLEALVSLFWVKFLLVLGESHRVFFERLFSHNKLFYLACPHKSEHWCTIRTYLAGGTKNQMSREHRWFIFYISDYIRFWVSSLFAVHFDTAAYYTQ